MALTLVNVELGKLDPLDPLRIQRTREYNEAQALYYCGKWYAQRGMESGSKSDWATSKRYFKRASRLQKRLVGALKSRKKGRLLRKISPLERKGTEIPHYNEVPLVPSVTPVIVLQGTDREMGAQYAIQMAEIFGLWTLEKCHYDFSAADLRELRRWEAEHRQHTPEIIEFCHGWVEGAKTLGVNLSYDEVLNLWVGHEPPATSPLNTDAGLPGLPPIACTSLATWGSASLDGKLVAGATGDHDLTYQATVVVYPETGNPFMHTVFGVYGTSPTVGPHWFFGHPGMNRAGVAYVHHGGGPKILEPRSTWGYGLRRTASVWHALRTVNSAAEARALEEAWPIGDIGKGDQATVGGFYADDNYGYVIESRKSPLAIREAGLMGERDFLYANNSAMHPEAIQSEWMQVKADDWHWDEEGGWRPKHPKGMTKSLGMLFKWFSGSMNMSTVVADGLMFAYWNSYNRNVFGRRMAEKLHGTFDEEVMQAFYRTGGSLPEGDWNKAVAEYKKTGEWGQISMAHSSNAFVAVMKPSENKFSLCTGPAERGVTPISPDLAISIHDETNAFWDLELAETPQEMAEKALRLATELIEDAEDALRQLPDEKTIQEQASEWLKDAELELKSANRPFRDQNQLALRIRQATRAQVRARQVIQLLNPPNRFEYPTR